MSARWLEPVPKSPDGVSWTTSLGMPRLEGDKEHKLVGGPGGQFDGKGGHRRVTYRQWARRARQIEFLRVCFCVVV